MKIADRNLLLLGLPALAALVVGIAALRSGDDLMRAAQAMAPEAPGGDVGDVEGYAFLIQFIGSGMGQLASLVVYIVGVLLVFYGGAMILLNILARVVYKPAPGRILAYRILIGLDLAVLLMPAPSLLSTFFRSLEQDAPCPQLLATAGLLFLLGALAARNTFTRRILPPAPVPDPPHAQDA